ncbi:MAG TPA: L-threonylcarbamoyladenylate synthase [Thermosynechococcaceae cyanobacterium]
MPQVSFQAFVAGVMSGSLGSFPTDTVPALAVRPTNADLIFQAKQRSWEKPLILMVATIDDGWAYVSGTPAERQVWQRVAKRFWPGALTLVLPASDRVPPSMNPKTRDTIGVRVPDHAIALAILRQTGPLATTSANRSGESALQTLAEIEAQFPEVLTLLPIELKSLPEPPSAGGRSSGTPSTVARWTGSGWETLRQGAVVLEEDAD